MTPARRRWSFSLRTLFVVVTVLGCWIGVSIHQAREQAVTATALEKFGFQLEYAGEQPATYLEFIRVLIGEPKPRNVVGVYSGNADSPVITFTDADCVHLARLTHLETVDLGGTSVTDLGLERLQGLLNLSLLSLCNVKVTAAGREQLQRKLPKCTIF